MYQWLLGIAAAILFGRMARADEESPALWATLGAVAWFLPSWYMGFGSGYIAIGVLFGVYVVVRMLKDPKGGRVR